MVDLSFQDRLQPALLDRLEDDEPDKKQESVEKRTITKRNMRQSVLRNLVWLFNTTGIESSVDFTALPYAERSVINYGLSALSGQIISDLDVSRLEQMIRQAIVRFEPRILPDSVNIKVVNSESQVNRHNMLNIQFNCDLWAQSEVVELSIEAQIDKDTGKIVIKDQANITLNQDG